MDTGFLVVTGSRVAPDWLKQELRIQLPRLAQDARDNHGVQRFVLLQGGARGVDLEARCWAEDVQPWPVTHKQFDATWEAACDPACCRPGHRRERSNGSDFCPAQGVYRNGRIVQYAAEQQALGAWVQVAAFYNSPRSTGTQNCVTQAQAAGLNVQEFGDAPTRTEAPGEAMPGVRPENSPLF